MNDKNISQEYYKNSCKYLLERIIKETDLQKRYLLLEDFATKNYLFNELHDKEKSKKIDTDIAIFVIVKNELNAIKAVLGIKNEKKCDDKIDDLLIWKTEIKQETKKFSTIIVFVAEPTNIICAVACLKVFFKYQVKTAVLVGIAAGVENKVKVGDVVGSTHAIYYEHQSLDNKGAQIRPRHHKSKLNKCLSGYTPSKGLLIEKFKKGVEILRELDSKLENMEISNSEYHGNSIILSGEKLIRNGSLPDLIPQYHGHTRAFDQELGGFGYVCEEEGIPWVAFRGISDLGNEETKPLKDENKMLVQSKAALAAAAIAITFLETDFYFLEKESSLKLNS